jgi:hypothetical protein
MKWPDYLVMEYVEGPDLRAVSVIGLTNKRFLKKPSGRIRHCFLVLFLCLIYDAALIVVMYESNDYHDISGDHALWGRPTGRRRAQYNGERSA